MSEDNNQEQFEKVYTTSEVIMLIMGIVLVGYIGGCTHNNFVDDNNEKIKRLELDNARLRLDSSHYERKYSECAIYRYENDLADKFKIVEDGI